MMDILSVNADCITVGMSEEEMCVVDAAGVAYPAAHQIPDFATRIAAEIMNIRIEVERLLAENTRLRTALALIDPDNEALP